jgi:hypothetical protein
MAQSNKTLHRLGLVLFVGLLVLVLQTSIVGAAVRESLHFTVTCNGFTTNNGGIIMDRDNTGTGMEMITMTATDGAGNVLWTSADMRVQVGGRMYFGDDTAYTWSTVSTFNPITVSVISPAGNGFEEQVVYQANGYCASLNTLLEDGTVIIAETNPSVPINAVPPMGLNPENIGPLYPGYLVVNTAWLNIRSGDGPQYTLVGRLAGGTELEVLGVNPARTWWYIEAGDIKGWVINDYVVNRGDLSDTPVVVAQGELRPVRFFLYLDAPMWALPGRGGGSLCWLEGEKEYLVVGRSFTGLSIKVEAECDGEVVTGWFPHDEGAIRNDGDLRIPVLDN